MQGTIADKGAFGDGVFSLKVEVPMTPEYAELLATRAKGPVQIVFANARDFESPALMSSQPDEPALPGVKVEGEGEGSKDAPHDKETGEILEGDGDEADADEAVEADDADKTKSKKKSDRTAGGPGA